MAETYCGKSCNSCSRKKDLNCGGCRVGPGRPYSTECTIAKCALSRKRRECEGCVNASTCFTLKGANRMAEDRYLKQARQKAERYQQLENSQVLSKWMTILFWLEIATVVLNVVAAIVNGQGEGVSAGGFFSAPSLIIHALIMIRISCTSNCFKLAGIFSLIYAGLELTNAVMPFVVGDTWPVVIVSVVVLVMSLLAVYQEFSGYAAVTQALDENLSNKWDGLWIVELCCLIATGGSVVVMAIMPLVGMLAMLFGMVGSVAVSIVKLIYLRDSAKLFRLYAEKTAEII